MSYKVKGLKLEGHPGAQCRVQIEPDGQIVFISYVTEVIRAIPSWRAGLIDGDKVICVGAEENTNGDYYFVECTGTYSRTTAKQITWFLREYFPTLSLRNMRAAHEYNEYYIAHRKDR